MDEAERQLAVLKQRLGVSSDADIAERLPSPDALELVRALATSALERRPEMVAARLAVTEAEAAAEVIRVGSTPRFRRAGASLSGARPPSI